MRIVHELGQLAYGGVEKVIHNIIKFDKENEHVIFAYKDGPFKEELEKVGAKIVLITKEVEVDFSTDLIHIHSGGAPSKMAEELGESFPTIETIHSPVRSAVSSKLIKKRVGVTDTVTRMNENCVTILNGIDIEGMEPTISPDEIRKSLDIPYDARVIGRLGRLGRDKCVEEWLLACHEAQKEIDFIPLIVGDVATDNQIYLANLKLMAASLPVKNVIWAGFHPNIADYMQIMDVFLYPSPTEGFGLVFAEAMVMEVPIVTYDTDVTREVIGGYAILTQNGIQGLVNGINRALNQHMRDEIIPMAHEYAKEVYDARRMVADYQDLYKEIAQ